MYLLFKRLGDIFFSIIGLLLLFPIIALITLMLFIANKGKPFFLQKRPGLGGQIFTIVKFKTMNDLKDASGNLLPDIQRITKIGGIIRDFSLDEILQLINVLMGHMSIVGPRPLLIAYLPLYNEHQAKRHNVKPGITGWAQINGRNAISWEEKFNLDVWYVDHISFFTDLRILWKTVSIVFNRKGVSASASNTMPMFTGTSE